MVCARVLPLPLMGRSAAQNGATSNMIKSILLTGVGGQGILFAAGIIASAAEAAGFNVTTNEIHGMAQRGGSVTAQVRYGEGSFAPLAVSGSIDVIAAMEHIEAVRYAHWLKPGGLAAVAKTSVIPVTVTTGACTYPSDVEARLHAVFPRLIYIDCNTLAQELGNIRLANTILTGALSNGLPEISEDNWRTGLLARVKKGFEEANLTAFTKGRMLCSDI